MNVQSQPLMTVDAFFRWAEGRPEKYELVNGVPCMLPWVKLNHSRIVTNLTVELAKRLERSRFEIVTTDFGVRVGQNSVRFPDLMVMPAGDAGDTRETQSPLLLVEILSDSTMHADFGDKRREYFGLPALKTYLVVAQDKRHVWCWSRDEDGNWPADPLQIVGDGAEIVIRPLGLSLPIEALYVGVN